MLKRLLRVLIPLSLVILFILPAIPVSAIKNGTFDGTSHPYVCLVVFYDAQNKPLWRTTGELISSTKVLTAGHGTYGTAGARVWFLNTIPASSPTGYPYGGPDSYHGTPYTNPDYRAIPNPGLPGFDYHDVGVVILDNPAPITTYAALPSAGQSKTLRTMSLVDLVGYGVTSQVKGGGVSPSDSWTWNRQRNYAQANLVQSKDKLSSEYLKLSANPAMEKGSTTFGDSGGPILKAGTNIILGINAFVTNSNCTGVTYAQRIDIQEILDWIADPIP